MRHRMIGEPLDVNWCRSRVIAMRRWQCALCGYIYDEAEGDPDGGVPPGTRWEDVPDDWVCPECGVGKEDFEMVVVEEAG